MSQPDWSKAPEGHPLWLEDIRPNRVGDRSGWVLHNDDGYISHDGIIRWRHEYEGRYYKIHRKPDEPQWTGEGLPPVGAECECRFAVEDFKHWHSGACVAVGNDPEGREVCVVQVGRTVAVYRTGDHIRPIRTPEQIAAEERERAIKDMLTATYTEETISRREVCELLYDAGCRLPAKP